MTQRDLAKILGRRRRRQVEAGRAVSPVVATLILILIAVAAAAALYLWLVAWQGGVTKGIGSPGAQATLYLGGSSAMYPFDQLAVTQFEQNNTDVVIGNSGGGTGAGMLAVCHGSVQIGTAASPQVLATLQSSDGCPATTVITTVAYDAIDLIVSNSNTHGLVSISASVAESIFIAAGDGGSTAGLTGGISSSYAFPDLPTPAASGYVWDQIPACVATTAATCSGSVESYPAATTCDWSVCATGTQTIGVFDRSDNSASDQVLTGRLLGVGDSAGTTAGLSFTGCGSTGQLTACGLSEPLSAGSDQAMITAVAGNANAIGFASDGGSRTTGSGVTIVPFEGVGQTAAVTPTTGSTGTIAGGINGNLVTGYVGWRPFQYVTTSTPTGEVQDFISWVLDPANNIAIASESNEISYYQG